MNPGQKQKVILVADDDSEDQELLEEAIFEVDPDTIADMVWNGKEALDYLENCPGDKLPCAIILDYSMPILNGAEVLAIIGKNPRFSAIPKFIWSTSSTRIHIQECMDNGAVKYFVKPDSPGKLRAVVEEILAACGNHD
ncbi:MAG TPA: response regulator [Puia sp.]|nr:response regulator [Puia sp.]